MNLIPQSLAGRTLVILLVGLTVSHFASMFIHYTDRHEAFVLFGGGQIADRIATINRLIEDTPIEERAALIETVNSPTLTVRWTPDRVTPENAATDWRTELTEQVLRMHLGSPPPGDLRVTYSTGSTGVDTATFGERRRMMPGHSAAMEERMRRMMAGRSAVMEQHMRQMMGHFRGAQTLWVDMELPDGSWLQFRSPYTESIPFWSLRFVLSMVVMGIAVLVLSVWAVRRLTRPLDRFARAAQRLGVDVEAPPLPEIGTLEVKQAAAAFNEMQRGIRRLVDDRTQMLAAISHDLRTPVTRMRLRAETIEQPDLQEDVLSDLAEMETMVSSVLAFAREDAKSEETVVVDVRAMLDTVCDGLEDLGGNVRFAAEEPCYSMGRPTALRRALTNVIDNAIKYGGHADVSLGADKRFVCITVRDDGPGIPEDEVEKVFSPFYRLERSRSRETGGTGLGLSIARSIVRSHGGEIEIQNRQDGGLTATITLPAVSPGKAGGVWNDEPSRR